MIAPMSGEAAELLRIRTRLKLTQLRMAARFGVGLRTYQRWESGETQAKRRHVELARIWATKRRA